ncbi:MAG: hypothetical protein A3F84_28115 [Candidatus Handelsmanbacteria bacterium RIFCSPLOWO2_12_FULL_64_10]|uniref:Uncharacterized protein n=1 Tax=Handelsmanbacteria sp. (strain RIFCSPLOWO2_12_FULL_64_10) TaxID=1817868 RepID=A0A1F6CHY9_HANXR|nr:MAG: hypothetical protein A3F84_28115 [Candidatus Handelsmanbacteria bacterium RIFCSPLOWO2_12_FULL_64_10]
MADQKLSSFVVRLYRKTRSGELQWKQTGARDVFMAQFTKYSVFIHKCFDEDERSEFFKLVIWNEDGEVVEELPSYVLREHVQEADEMLSEMYSTARRVAMGVDKALDALLEDLGKSEEEDVGF